MTPSDLVLVVPCYNEASRLRSAEFLDFVARRPCIRLLFVDDGSVDGTMAVLERMARESPAGIRVMRLPTNQGKAEAVRRGLLDAMDANPALVGFWDADLSTPLSAIDDFLTVAAKLPSAELILGSRVLLMGRDIRRKSSRHYLGRVFATAASLALDLPVYDTQCGAKIFRANDALRRVLAAPFRSPWIFDVELLARYLAIPVADGGGPRRSRIYELAVPAWHDVPGSKLEALDFLRSIVELIAVWRDRRLGTRRRPAPAVRPARPGRLTSMRAFLRWLPVAAVAILFCAPLFVGLGLNDQENDEAIYSYAVQSIVETGDWLNPRLAPSADAVFLEKPPLKFWIVALPIRLGLLPDNDFGLRFWDAVCGAAAFLYVFAVGRRMAGWFCGAAAVLILYSFDSLIFTHGLRGNNMEAPLVLAYAGAAYHFLRWHEASRPRTSAGHALGVGLYFLLAFMTKFVASFFLPMILIGSALELTAVRAKAVREWRAWGLSALVVTVLAAPWFLYQMSRPDSGLWAIMLGEHVYQRFNGWLDPTHLRPWSYYFTDLLEQMRAAGTLWVVLAGGFLVHLRVIRQRWLVGTVALYWFWVPFVLMSLGTSKLRHYTYPFLPPLALAGGYVAALAVDTAVAIAAGQLPRWLDRLFRGFGTGRVGTWIRSAAGRLGERWPTWPSTVTRVARFAMLGAAAVGLALAAVALAYPHRLRIGGAVLVRDPSVWKPCSGGHRARAAGRSGEAGRTNRGAPARPLAAPGGSVPRDADARARRSPPAAGCARVYPVGAGLGTHGRAARPRCRGVPSRRRLPAPLLLLPPDSGLELAHGTDGCRASPDARRPRRAAPGPASASSVRGHSRSARCRRRDDATSAGGRRAAASGPLRPVWDVTRAGFSHELLERGGRQRLPQPVLRHPPDRVHPAPLAPVAATRQQAHVQLRDAVDRLENVEQRRGPPTLQQFEPALLAAARDDEFRANEALEDLRQEGWRHARRLGQLGQAHARVDAGTRQLDHHADTVVGRTGELHSWSQVA